MKFVRAFLDGGTERQFVELALALEPSRVAVHFGCLQRAGQLAERIETHGIPLFDYNVRSLLHPAAMGSQLRLARDIRRHGIQIVHTYSAASHFFAIPAAKLAGARVVASIRDMGVDMSPAKLRMQRLALRFADQILVNATAIRRWLIDGGYDGSRITVVPNGVITTAAARTPRMGRLRRELGLPLDAPLVGVIGRLTRLKGIEDFLRAAAIIAPLVPAAHFLIVGGCLIARGDAIVADETYLAELRRLAAQLGIEGRVHFTGFRSDVDEIVSELTVSVQPSLSEGLSNVLLESMAAGVPVVATRVGGAGEVVHDGETGFLVTAGDFESMAAAVCRYADDPALAARIGEAARKSIGERYSMSRVVDSTTRVYEALFAQRGRAATGASLNPI